MDFDRYGEAVKRLADAYNEYVIHSDKRMMFILRKMEKIALAQDAPELAGFVYHAMAYANYYITSDYNAFLKNLRRSAACLLRASDKSEMKQVYYMIAIDAMNKGSLDLAYYYASLSRNVALEASQEDSALIIDGMLATLLMRMGAFDEAYEHIERSLGGIARYPDHPMYRINVIIAGTIAGMVLVSLSRVEEAEARYKEATKHLKAYGEPIDPNARLDLEGLGLRIALEREDKSLIRKRFRLFMKELAEDIQILDHMQNIQLIHGRLLERGAYAEAGQLLDVLDRYHIPSSATATVQIFEEMKTDYFLACGDEKALEREFAARHQENLFAINEKKNSDEYVRELIRLADELQKEREKVYQEYEAIKRKANTDDLCNIPNRHALNSHLEQVYEHAFHERKRMGVVLMDVDGLKAYNDTYGHVAGDGCLKQIAGVLSREAQKPGIFAARYGGDEFVIVYDNFTDAAIRASLKRICAETPIAVSAGISNDVPDSRQRSWDFLARADGDLYRNKRKAHSLP